MTALRHLLLLAAPGPARDALRAALADPDLAVGLADDDAAARARYAEGRPLPVAVVIDVQAGGRPFGFLEWLRLQSRFDRVPVVLVGDGEAGELARLAEPCAALPRETPLEQLRARLAALRDRARPILIVDDDPDYAAGTADLLDRAGYPTVVACSAQRAIDFLEHAEAAAILLDRTMPDMDGTEVFSWIRGQRRLSKVPVVFISGDPPPRRAPQINHDRAYWLTKPVPPALLLRVVADHVGGGRA